MINIWDTVSAFIHHPGMCLSTDIPFEQKNEHITMGHLYIRFIY